MKIAKAFPGRTFLCYYTGVKEIKSGNWYTADNEKVNTDRTISLDNSYNQLDKQLVQLPTNLDDYPEFKQHLKNLIRIVMEDEKGNKKAEWRKTGDDHYFHAFNYANIAADLFGKFVMPEIFSL